jgi:hypothetical protein
MSTRDTSQQTMETIKSVFPENVYTVTLEYSVIKFLVIKISKKNPISDCIYFKIYNDHIHIESINRCGDITGNTLLKKIFDLAQKLPQIQYIHLEDKSYILKCNKKISLATIKILTKGQSWYNEHGYKSKFTESELESNKIIINKKYRDFKTELYQLLITLYNEEYLKNIKLNEERLETIKKEHTQALIKRQALEDKVDEDSILEKELLDAEIKRYEEEIEGRERYNKNYDLAISNEKERISKLIEYSITLFPLVSQDITVQEYFTSIWSIINTNIEGYEDEKLSERCEWLSKFLDMIDMSCILNYYPYCLEKRKDSTTAIKNKYLKYKNKYLNLKNQLG